MRAAQQAARDAVPRFPVRIRIAVPPEGLTATRRRTSIIAQVAGGKPIAPWIIMSENPPTVVLEDATAA